MRVILEGLWCSLGSTTWYLGVERHFERVPLGAVGWSMALVEHQCHLPGAGEWDATLDWLYCLLRATC